MSRLYLSNPCAFFFYHRTRCCGRSRRPAFPAPSLQGGSTNSHNSGETRRGNESLCVVVPPPANTAVVPAQAGTHTPRRNLLLRDRSRLSLNHADGWLWAPAFAGATESTHRPLRLNLPLGHDAIAAAFLGLVERAVAAVDQIFHGLAALELPDPDRHRDAGQRLTGGAAGDLAIGERAANPLSRSRANREVRARQNRDQLLAAVAGRQVALAHTVAQRLRHETEHLVADTMAETVVELLEVVDIDQQRAERLALLHGVGLRGQ